MDKKNRFQKLKAALSKSMTLLVPRDFFALNIFRIRTDHDFEIPGFPIELQIAVIKF